MKKLSLYVFLALFFCNFSFAQELIKIPVHVHIVQIEEGDYKTITTPEDVREDFKMQIGFGLKQIFFGM